MWVIPLIFAAALAPSACPDFSGTYIKVREGSPLKIRITIKQMGCDRVTVTRSANNGSYEYHELRLDGVPQPDSAWFGGTGPRFTSARFENEDLVIADHATSNSESMSAWSETYRRRSDEHLCMTLRDARGVVTTFAAKVQGKGTGENAGQLLESYAAAKATRMSCDT